MNHINVYTYQSANVSKVTQFLSCIVVCELQLHEFIRFGTIFRIRENSIDVLRQIWLAVVCLHMMSLFSRP